MFLSLCVCIIACILFEIIRVCFDKISLFLFFFSLIQKSKILYLPISAFLPFDLRLIKNIFNNTTTAKTLVHAKNMCFHVFFFFAKHKRRYMSLAQLGEPIREVILEENGGKDFASWLMLRLYMFLLQATNNLFSIG